MDKLSQVVMAIVDKAGVVASFGVVKCSWANRGFGAEGLYNKTSGTDHDVLFTLSQVQGRG